MKTNMKKTASALLFLAAAFPIAARADDAATEEATVKDVRCLLTSMYTSQLNDAKFRAAGMVSALYWMGKIDGRAPDLDLEASLLKEIKALKPDELREEAMRCGTEMRERSAKMKKIGEDLITMGKAEMQLENSR